MKDGVPRVLPALVGKAVGRLATKPSPSRSPCSSIQRRAASMLGQISSSVSRSPVRSKYMLASRRKSGVASTVP